MIECSWVQSSMGMLQMRRSGVGQFAFLGFLPPFGDVRRKTESWAGKLAVRQGIAHTERETCELRRRWAIYAGPGP